MAKFDDLLGKKDARMDDVPNAFIGRVENLEIQIFDRLITLLGGFEIVGGNIVISSENLAEINAISEALLNAIFTDTDYNSAILGFLNQYNEQTKLNIQLLSESISNFSNKNLYDDVVRNSKIVAVNAFGRDGVDTEFITPLKQILNDAVVNNKSIGELVVDLNLFVQGNPEQLGQLSSYVSRFSRDLFNISDRQYTKLVSEDIGIVFYFYSSGLVKDSRNFCVARAAKFWHKNEISAWGRIQKWQGRNKNTNTTTIFSFLGGYNCIHTLLPVSTDQVPQDVIDRNIANGNLKRAA